jgi:hypothetical protein
VRELHEQLAFRPIRMPHTKSRQRHPSRRQRHCAHPFDLFRRLHFPKASVEELARRG